MKVTQNNTPINMDAYLRQIRQQRQQPTDIQTTANTPAGASDKVQLSAQAKQIQQAARMLNTSMDVRNEKVQQVKMDLENGTYQVNGGQVANDMLHETFENGMLLNKINTRA
jgi:negative regulator of flagellin synthesis FlgM